jgi:hemerythrin-like metal-binding protein
MVVWVVPGEPEVRFLRDPTRRKVPTVTSFDWDPALETGHDDIDEQHKSLFVLANELQEALELDENEAQAVDDAIYALTAYVVQHFHDEEELMDECGYPGAAAHLRLHQHLTAETLRLAARYFNGEDMVPANLAPFVADWLREHIRAEDMHLVEFMKNG